MTVATIEGEPAEQWKEPTHFDKLTPQFPQGGSCSKIPRQTDQRAGSRSAGAAWARAARLIVSPPRVGKTILLKEIAKAIRVNHPEIVLHFAAGG